MNSRIINHAGAWSFLAMVIFCVSFFAPLFFSNYTVSPFDLCYFRLAYREQRPLYLRHPSNRLLVDPVMQLQPWDLLIHEGKVPFPWLWNPYAGFGAPLLGNGQSSPFYPLKWIAYARGARKGFGYLCFLKMLFAGAFTWLYLRKIGLSPLARLFGSVCFMASGFVIAWLQYPMSGAAIFLPLFLLGCEYLAEKRFMAGFLILVLGISCSALAGHPETTFHSLVVTGLYIFLGSSRKRCNGTIAGPAIQPHTLRVFAIFVAACLLGLLIACIQLLPTLEYILHSATLRARGGAPQKWLSSHWFTANLEYARREILSYIVPNTWGNPSMYATWWNQFSNYNESAGYTGIGALLLSIVAWRYFRRDRHIRAFCLLQALSLIFILRITPFRFNPEALPIFNIVANKRFLFAFCFSNAALAALVIDRFWRGREIGSEITILLWGAAAALMACALYDYYSRFAGAPHSGVRAFGGKQLLNLSWALLPWLILCFTRKIRPPWRSIALVCLVLTAAADLFANHHRYNPFINANDLYPGTKAIAFLHSKTSQGVPPRVFPVGGIICPNVAALYGIDSSVIYDAITASWYQDFSNSYPFSSWDRLSTLPLHIASASSIQYLWTKEKGADTVNGLALLYADGNSRVYENTGALPRAYLATSWRFVSSVQEAIQSLKGIRDPQKAPSLIEHGGMPDAAPENAVADNEVIPARIVHYSPQHVSVEVPGGHKGFLILNDLYFPGWTARCGNSRKDIYRANGIFRGVWVDGHERAVEFIYRPFSFYIGAGLSCTGICVSAIILIRVIQLNRSRSSH